MRLAGWASGDTSPAAALGLLETARQLRDSGKTSDVPAADWHRYLDLTRRPAFLQALPDREARDAWADTSFALIPLSGNGLEETLVLNREDQVVAGICYRQPDATATHLVGIARASSLKGRGLSAALLEDFCSRMTTRGVGVVSTHFVSQEFFREHGFRVDPRWGGLVCFFES